MAMPFISLLAAANVIVAVADGPPKANIEATCRTSEREIRKLFGDTTAVNFESCMKQQDEAFEKLRVGWETYPPGDRSRCVQTRGYMPSYVEWLTCLETERDLRRIRAQESNP